MGRVMEVFNSDGDVWCAHDDAMSRLEVDSPLVGWMLERIERLYPQAMKALTECYRNSARNIPYYNYLRVKRFCKCNFGVLDHTEADIKGGCLNFERVPCPLRGECKYEDVICHPTMETRLSGGEKRVMRLVCEGRSNAEIADELYLSPNTVKRHISTAFLKVGVKSRGEFIKYARDNKIFV